MKASARLSIPSIIPAACDRGRRSTSPRPSASDPPVQRGGVILGSCVDGRSGRSIAEDC